MHLGDLKHPNELHGLSPAQLEDVARQIRERHLQVVSTSGGHLGPGLGVVELTLALYQTLDLDHDRVIWDVGHQAYPHKLITGRFNDFDSLRQQHGVAGYLKRTESDFDHFGAGHASTSISAALGMAMARDNRGESFKCVAVIGDGALTGGMALEAINHAGHLPNTPLLVVLNDNDMSISRNVGGLSNYFAKLLSSRTYNQVRDSSKKVLKGTPHLMALAKKTEEHFKGMIAPGTLFEELGFNYIGPIDGHDLPLLVETLENIRELEGPQFLHVVTTKGKGFAPAEADPIGYHAINKIEPVPASKPEPVKPKPASPKYANVFGQWLCDAAEQDSRVAGITPAMCEGSDLLAFSERFPDRYFDVAIAEQHAVTLAAGLACDGAKPVVAIYSTFLQRAYDQLVHDVAIQNLDVLFAIDRAGLVGEDGPTHAGAFDISYLRCIPNMLVMTPSDENETRQLLHTGLEYCGPAAVRYPRGTGPGAEIQQQLTPLPIGKGRRVRDGSGIAILNFGTLLAPGLEAAEALGATVADMRFVKPLDEALVLELAETHDLLVTLEENVVAGGAGSAVTEFLNARQVSMPVLQLGLPDAFVEHGQHKELLRDCGLDADGIRRSIARRMEQLGYPTVVAAK